MLEYQFIKFSPTIPPIDHEVAVPTKNGKEQACFFIDNEDQSVQSVDIVTQDGRLIKKNAVSSPDGKYNALYNLDMLAPRECYRLRLTKEVEEETILSETYQEVNVPKSKVSQGSGGTVTFEEPIMVKAGKQKLVLKGYYAREWRDVGAPQDIKTTIYFYAGGKAIGSLPNVKGATDAAITINLKEDSSVTIVVAYTAGYTEHSDPAITISFDSVSSVVTHDVSQYSNLLVREEQDSNYSHVMYSCKEPAFGFPFGGAKYIQQVMPLMLTNPQYKQEDKVYTKLNGENVVLYANITKEYEGHTDYIPMEWHEKILMALSCDYVYINGERVTKTGSYEIDHEKFTYTDCGIKLLRATFKMTTNVTQRNSNY